MAASDLRQKEQPALIRLFVGIPIDDEVRRGLAEIRDRLKRARAHVGWVPSRNYHLSLAFLGDAPREMVPELGEALDDAAGRSFAFSVSGIGTFGSRRSPRVIWAGVEAPDALTALYERLWENLAALDFPVDTRPFRPHVTLGRVRSSRGKRELAAALEHVADSSFGQVDATVCCLYRSILQPDGAVYTVLHEARLGADE